MARKAKAKAGRSKARVYRYMVRFETDDIDIRLLEFVKQKKRLKNNVTVLRLALAELAERCGYELGPDFGNLKTPLHSSPVEASRA